MRLKDKVAIVTGSGRGLGKGIAMKLAEEGAKVVVADMAPADDTVAEIVAKGGTASAFAVNVSKQEEVQALVKYAIDTYGTLDIMVNNAGIIKRIPMVEMTKQQWDQVINVDLTGPFLCAKAVLPGMIKKGYGKIINACSMMSELGRETVSAYAAAKGGLKMLTKNICSEYGQYNIQCNAIGPGYIATPQTAPLRAKQADGSMAPFDRFIRSKTPAQRWGETEDLEGLAVFLASPASDFINGQVVYIDGGILAYIGQDPSQLDESKFQDVTGVEDIKVADH